MNIENEHFEWWQNIPILWKRIFLVSIDYPEKNECKIEENGYEIYNKPADFMFYLNYPIREISEKDLKLIFSLKKILYDGYDVNPERNHVVHEIPPLHYFEELEFLSLSQNYVKDISGLQGLKKLKYLCLHENSITENEQLENLSKIISLEYLDLSANSITDFSFLSNLINLKELHIWGQWHKNPVRISGFDNFRSLLCLNLDAPIDLTPLLDLKNLQELYIGSDEYDFDCSKIEDLIHSLSNIYIDYYLPHSIFVKNISDDSFLWKILLEPSFILDKDFDKSRLLSLKEKVNSSSNVDFKELVNRALCYYEQKLII